MTVSQNYSGKRVDLSIFPDLKSPSTPVDAKFGSNPKAIAGPMASAQNFVRLLLTPKGYYKSDPSIGSDFYAGLSGRTVRYSSDLLHLFLIESNNVLDYMALVGQTLPDDERIKTADLIDANITGTTIDMVIEITTAAGETLTILLPVQWSL